ncbi:Origin recognition complex subunit 2 [Portunus trituberculatus]|uniref:Origin recognition complex subunit 2 n=1 Tax=Portunus trituberculatus TaxID=210409 RepID=A0A5B7EBK5_PORTR|nr:Origin recognition complex subunit 2 [Portunus trituberculatus]
MSVHVAVNKKGLILPTAPHAPPVHCSQLILRCLRVVAPLSQRNCGRTQNSCNGFSHDGAELPTVHETDEYNQEVFFKPTELLGNEENHIRTATVFGFHTPKKRLSMLEKAESATKTGNSPRTPHTPHSTHRSLPGTPRTPKTPNSARKSMRFENPQKCKKTVCGTRCSNSLHLQEKSKESATNTRFTDIANTKKKTYATCHRNEHATLNTGPANHITASTAPDHAVMNSEDYFIANGNSKKITTSDHTLSHLKTSGLSADTLQAALAELAPAHPEERQALVQEHVASFPRWMTFLCEGFSLFLYGLGSMSFVDLRQRCWEKFLVNSDLSLRAQLTEFKDHKLIRFKKGTDGAETIVEIECPAMCLAPLLSLEGRWPVRREDLDTGDGGPMAGRLTRAIAFRRPPDRNQHGGGEV